MIKKLKIKFIILSMTSLFVLLIVIVAGMNIINYRSVVSEADETLELLSKNKGSFPEHDGKKGDKMPPDMNPELPYESRFFSVLLSKEGNVIQTDTSRIKSVDSTEAVDLANKALNKKKESGFIGNFRYSVSKEAVDTRITFLDCGRMLDSYNSFLLASSGMALVGFIIVFFVIFFFAGKIIHPIAESYEKQKRFITDAGHEIKTPLTIINANVDLLELDMGENESLSDIKQQTKRLTALTNDLVYLSRMEESTEAVNMIEFPVSELVLEAVNTFKPLAQMKNKEFMWDIEPMLSLNGNAKAIEQLLSILLENALKYSNENGLITVHFKKQGKTLNLKVFNTTDFQVVQESLKYVFDRFYRGDSSRNSQTGGHGIGLSVANAIVNAHNGKISASTNDEKSFLIEVILPA